MFASRKKLKRLLLLEILIGVALLLAVKEISHLRDKIDLFESTELIFISFESLEVVERFKNEYLPEKSSFVTFAQGSQTEVEEILEQDLVYPYMLWYDDKGIQKAQHRGVFPISRVIEVIDQS